MHENADFCMQHFQKSYHIYLVEHLKIIKKKHCNGHKLNFTMNITLSAMNAFWVLRKSSHSSQAITLTWVYLELTCIWKFKVRATGCNKKSGFLQEIYLHISFACIWKRQGGRDTLYWHTYNHTPYIHIKIYPTNFRNWCWVHVVS